MSVACDPDIQDIEDHPQGYKGLLTKGKHKSHTTPNWV